MNSITTTIKLIALVIVAIIALSVALSMHQLGVSNPSGAVNRLTHAFVTFHKTTDTSGSKNVAANSSGLAQSTAISQPTIAPKPSTNPKPTTAQAPKPTSATAKIAATKAAATPTPTKPRATPTPATHEQVPFGSDSQSATYAQAPNTGGGHSFTYQVQCGDTLTSIATGFFGNASYAQQIYDANSRLIPDINNLACGITLRIP
jgi:nucleoid-associated protein YgaU